MWQRHAEGSVLCPPALPAHRSLELPWDAPSAIGTARQHFFPRFLTPNSYSDALKDSSLHFTGSIVYS